MKVTIQIVSEIHNNVMVCGNCFSLNHNSPYTAHCEHFNEPLATADRPVRGGIMKFKCCSLCVRAQDQDRG